MLIGLIQEVLCPTRGHKTLGAKWLFEPRFSHQSSMYLDSAVAPKSPTFHTANRCRPFELF
jgi:hypothetical protein